MTRTATATAETAEQREDERDDARAEREAQNADQQPREEAHGAAGGERSSDPAEHAPQDRAGEQREHEQERQQLEQARHALGRRATLGLGKRLALDDAQHAVHAGRDAAVVITAAERRHDDFVDDAIGGRIGQRTLEAVTHLDAHAAVLHRHQQQRAVVHAFAAELPRLGDAHRVLLDFFRLGGRHDEHRDLAALRLLERTQLGIECRGLVGREDAGHVGDR